MLFHYWSDLCRIIVILWGSVREIASYTTPVLLDKGNQLSVLCVARALVIIVCINKMFFFYLRCRQMRMPWCTTNSSQHCLVSSLGRTLDHVLTVTQNIFTLNGTLQVRRQTIFVHFKPFGVLFNIRNECLKFNSSEKLPRGRHRKTWSEVITKLVENKWMDIKWCTEDQSEYI